MDHITVVAVRPNRGGDHPSPFGTPPLCVGTGVDQHGRDSQNSPGDAASPCPDTMHE
jgi:hypothetical protein